LEWTLGVARAEMAMTLGMGTNLRDTENGDVTDGNTGNTIKEKMREERFDMGQELLFGGKGKKNNTNMTGVHDDGSSGQEYGIAGTVDMKGLEPPRLNECERAVVGDDRIRLRRENKQRRKYHKAMQSPYSQWRVQNGEGTLRTRLHTDTMPYRNAMCPAGQALGHPAATVLSQYAATGCPVVTGKPWTKEMMWEAVERGPHQSSLSKEAMEHFAAEAKLKVERGQAKLVRWDDIKHNPPPELKISPIAAVPHKSKAFRSILDLSYKLKLKNGGVVSSVNDTTEKLAPQGAIDQIGETLSRIIYAFAETDDDAKIFMAKWDIKDGFWRMDGEEGQEYNFAYVLPQPPGEPIILVVPLSLQMGWVESPPFFCAASETVRDIVEDYIETPVSSLPEHKFDKYVMTGEKVQELAAKQECEAGFGYMVEVYVDDFMAIVIPVTRAQLEHVGTAVMTGIHDVFPADEVDSEDPISEKKLAQKEGEFDTRKTILGFDFDGEHKTMWLEDAKREILLTVLKGWIRTAKRGRGGILFEEFRSVTAKIRHAFTCIPQGVAFLSPVNRILKVEPRIVYLHKNRKLLQAIVACRTLLRESFKEPTRCRELVSRWPDFVGIVDASSHGVGGVVFGEGSKCIPTVFRWQWPEDITKSVKSFENPNGSITNSDLEMAGMLMAWIVIEEVGGDLTEKTVALFGDNTPSISWIKKLASKRSDVAEQLVQALALRMKANNACPLITNHIAGKRNQIADVPSRSFGSNKTWTCETNHDFFILFNSLFPLPNQNFWSVFQFNYAIATRVTSVLQMKPFNLEEWRRLPGKGRHVGKTGKDTACLWESIRTCSAQPSANESELCQDSHNSCEKDFMEKELKYSVEQSLAQSRPLARRSPWCVARTPPK